MKRKATTVVGVVLTIAGVILLVVLAGPPPGKDCICSGEQCVWPEQDCYHPILHMWGTAQTCLEEWYCPEYYWESCGLCACRIW